MFFFLVLENFSLVGFCFACTYIFHMFLYFYCFLCVLSGSVRIFVSKMDDFNNTQKSGFYYIFEDAG